MKISDIRPEIYELAAETEKTIQSVFDGIPMRVQWPILELLWVA